MITGYLYIVREFGGPGENALMVNQDKSTGGQVGLMNNFASL